MGGGAGNKGSKQLVMYLVIEFLFEQQLRICAEQREQRGQLEWQDSPPLPLHAARQADAERAEAAAVGGGEGEESERAARLQHLAHAQPRHEQAQAAERECVQGGGVLGEADAYAHRQ